MNKNPNDSKNELKTNFPNKFKYYFTVYRIFLVRVIFGGLVTSTFYDSTSQHGDVKFSIAIL